MAKITKACQFTKAVLTEEDDGHWTITEYLKDNVNVYDLESVLNLFKDIDNLTVTIRQESGIAPVPVEGEEV